MNSDELLEAFRRECFDESDPPLWTDVEIYQYMDEAQKLFCRLTGGIADSTSALTTISVPASTEFVAFSPKILKLRSARRADGQFLDILNFEDLENGLGPVTYDYGAQVPRYKLDNRVGPLRALVVGMEPHKFRCIDLPASSETLKLIVYRLPLETITDDGDQEFEIDEQHHIHLLKWMKHRGYSKQDAETFDKGKRDQYELEFRSYCAQAKQERERLEHKYRTVAYGGI